ncbi:MAG: MarR family transcriptional regulator [Alphaproteobacteria bacterium]|nr:MarR family transcriptional regulator [Alphaproteobacteria bacterium]MBU1525203.1 MarR family transcriptional regulator [Alphaproteobacteria bacterium]MBU2117768.1 MarR family transcriptional regulator [Alphaproteobacteria bacterium]MBU2352199.1 MarR family transcriptional regulator [Alphaproteobacteria bacterium]MBU2381209.1 MarR family transcriptional regulator [Alphaproteobacteria bacterium]
MDTSSGRAEKELAVLRLIYDVSLRLGEEMRDASGSRLDPHQILALTLINRHAGLTQSDLADHLDRSAVHVSRLVDELESEGLVERRAHRFDRRSKDLHPTEQGAGMYSRMRDRALHLAAEIFKETPDERLDALSRRAVRISERLRLALSSASAPPGL